MSSVHLELIILSHSNFCSTRIHAFFDEIIGLVIILMNQTSRRLGKKITMITFLGQLTGMVNKVIDHKKLLHGIVLEIVNSES